MKQNNRIGPNKPFSFCLREVYKLYCEKNKI
nr:MAG TPA: hypothetical protein [Caudoviricetes sp.]